MAWNPDVYGKYQSNRFAPFHDLLALIQIKPGLEVIDLGCGTGEIAKELAEKLPSSSVLGIDSSAEMLEKAKAFAGNNLDLRSNDAWVDWHPRGRQDIFHKQGLGAGQHAARRDGRSWEIVSGPAPVRRRIVSGGPSFYDQHFD